MKKGIVFCLLVMFLCTGTMFAEPKKCVLHNVNYWGAECSQCVKEKDDNCQKWYDTMKQEPPKEPQGRVSRQKKNAYEELLETQKKAKEEATKNYYLYCE